MNKLDAHMHVWHLDRGDYDWLTPELADIYRDFSVDDVWSEASDIGVARTILVQAAASSAETDYLLSIARSDPRVAGVVGWVDLESETAVSEIRERATDPLILGLRPMIADLADPNWILKESLHAPLQEIAATKLIFEGHARSDLISVMQTLAERHPNLIIVLDHAGKPPIASQNLSKWRNDIENLARYQNVSCKVSGLLTETDPLMSGTIISDVIEHIGACFGPERLLWGSDWPVLTLASTYTDWAATSAQLLSAKFPEHHDAIWRDNAERIYLKRKGL